MLSPAIMVCKYMPGNFDKFALHNLWIDKFLFSTSGVVFCLHKYFCFHDRAKQHVFCIELQLWIGKILGFWRVEDRSQGSEREGPQLDMIQYGTVFKVAVWLEGMDFCYLEISCNFRRCPCPSPV